MNQITRRVTYEFSGGEDEFKRVMRDFERLSHWIWDTPTVVVEIEQEVDNEAAKVFDNPDSDEGCMGDDDDEDENSEEE